MVEAAVRTMIKGIAGELAPFHRQIIAAGELRVNPELPHRLQKHRALFMQIKLIGGHQDCEIQISQIMVHRSAPGTAPGQQSPVLPQRRQPALL